MPRLPKKRLFSGVAVLSLLAAILIGAYLYLPRYAETRLIPELARSLGFTAQTVKVQKIGFSAADLGPLTISGAGTPALALQRLHLTYSPLTILAGRIGRIRLEGVRITLRIVDGTLFWGDRPLTAPVAAAPTAPTALPVLPFEHCALTDALLTVDWEERLLELPFTLEVDTSGGGKGRWQVQALVTPPNSRVRLNAHVDVAAGRIELELPEALTTLETWNDLLPDDWRAAAGGLISSGRLSLQGRAAWRTNPPGLADGLLELTLEQAKLKSLTPAMAAALPLTRLQAELQQKPYGLALTGRAHIAGAAVTAAAPQLTVEGLSVDLPFAWPPEQTAAAGRLAAARIVWQKKELGDLNGLLAQQGEALRFDVTHRSKLLPGLRLLIQGTANEAAADLDLQAPLYRPATAIELGRFFKAAQGLKLSGDLAAEGRIGWRPTATKASARLRIDDGRLYDPARDLMLAGIQSRLQLDDALAPHSPPGQVLRVAALNIGKIAATDFKVNFQVAPPARLLIAQAALKWCQGDIVSAPLVLTSAAEPIATTLSVEGLNPAMMLEQLDLAQGSGEGTLVGRLPVRWSDGNLTFAKGALSTPPGQTGTIRLKELPDTEELLAGLPVGTPQHTQLDIALQALKDYTYHNIDLQVESQAEELVLRLQLAGKPNRLLPFAYDQALGQLKRVHGEGLAEFKGVDIDLNFRSPLNQILHYRELLKP